MRRPDPLWRKAPTALFRFPALAVAVVAGAFLLAVAAASAPLFSSAVGSSALSRKLADMTPFGAGPQFGTADGLFPGHENPFARRDRRIRQAAAGIPHLGARVFTMILSTEATITAHERRGPAKTVEVRPLARTGALQHVRKLAGGGGEGVWIADNVASVLGARPGDELVLERNAGLRTGYGRTSVRVAGVYRALWRDPSTPFWRNLYNQIYAPNPDASLPPSFLIGTPAELVHMAHAFGGTGVELRWELPLEGGSSLTLGEAERITAKLHRFQRVVESVGGSTGVGFRCRSGTAQFSGCGYQAQLAAAVTAAEDEQAAIRAPADLLSWAGTIVATAVVAAGAAYAMARRRVEARLLFARGFGPGGVGARTALEALLPAVLGSGAGVAVAYALVRIAGTGGAVDADALRSAGEAAAVRLPVALAVVAAVAAISFTRASASPGEAFRKVARVPWEIPVLALAAFFFARLHAGGGLSGGGEGAGHPSAYLVLFPLFFLAGTAGLAGRGIAAVLARLRARSEGFPDSAYLALRRLAAGRRLTVLVVVASAVALGIFVYAQTLVASLDRTVDAKSHIFVGSDVQGTVDSQAQLPRSFPVPLTKVTVKYAGGTLGGITGAQVDVMAVDPSTLARAAYWETEWASRPLADIARQLAARTPGPMPVLVAGGGDRAARALTIGAFTVPVRVVARSKAFPGMTLDRPLIVFDGAALARRAAAAHVPDPLGETGASSLVWAKGDERSTARALAASALRPFYLLTAEEIRKKPAIAAETRTFGFLRALGLAAACLAVVATLFYVQARQRSRVLAVALSRRMGLGDRTQDTSLALELAAILLGALVVAAALALVAARLIVGRVDPLAELPPGPLFRAPVVVIVATLAALALVSLVGALLANRAARRTNVVEVMRLGD